MPMGCREAHDALRQQPRLLLLSFIRISLQDKGTVALVATWKKTSLVACTKVQILDASESEQSPTHPFEATDLLGSV